MTCNSKLSDFWKYSRYILWFLIYFHFELICWIVSSFSEKSPGIPGFAYRDIPLILMNCFCVLIIKELNDSEQRLPGLQLSTPRGFRGKARDQRRIMCNDCRIMCESLCVWEWDRWCGFHTWPPEQILCVQHMQTIEQWLKYCCTVT